MITRVVMFAHDALYMTLYRLDLYGGSSTSLYVLYNLYAIT